MKHLLIHGLVATSLIALAACSEAEREIRRNARLADTALA